jgi:hypothetical protein
MVATPLNVVPALNDPPPTTVHVTPALVLSFATPAAKNCVAPPAITAFWGVTPTEIGLSVIVAVVDLVGSLTLVAMSVAVVVALIGDAGAL